MNTFEVIYRSHNSQDIVFLALLRLNELVYSLISSTRRLISLSGLNLGLMICLTFLKRSISLRHSTPPILVEWPSIHGILIVALDARMLGLFSFWVVLITKLFLVFI